MEDVGSRCGATRAHYLQRANEELRRIFTTYATDVMGFAPFSGPIENVPLVDLEGARRAWISEGSFADGELAVQLIARRKRRVEEFEAEAYERRVRIRREIENQNPGEREYFIPIPGGKFDRRLSNFVSMDFDHVNPHPPAPNFARA